MAGININLLGHIALDSDLGGRIGVQGNNFVNTVGYLNQFFEEVKDNPNIISSANRGQLSKLASSMAKLAEKDAEISRINLSSDPSNTLINYTEKTATDILNLTENQELMLPGGWKSPDVSHAMMYQFQKRADGSLRFSIYNAGAGLELEHHGKLSTSNAEHYYPVKSYEIPAGVSAKELNNLISRLTLALLANHPARKYFLCDAKKLYSEIEKSMPFLKAKSLAATGNLTTAGQLSGTCSQRSLHQMLKLNFDTLANYQRFILEFKIYAIKDYVSSYSVPRSKEIAAFIVLAIENTLKLLQEPGVFKENPGEKNIQADELIQLKLAVLEPDAIRAATTVAPALSKKVTMPYQFQTNQPKLFDKAPSLESSSSTRPKPMTLNYKSPLQLSDIQAFIDQCDDTNDHVWVFEQIEQLMLQLPIPTKPISHNGTAILSDYYDDIPFYHEIADNNQLQQMAEAIEELQYLYTAVAGMLLDKTPTPSLYVTQGSFLALRDYIDVQQCKQDAVSNKEHVRPSFHAVTNESLGGILRGMKGCPFVATTHADYDRRWAQLGKLYDDTNPKTNISSYGNNSYFYLSLYLALLDSEPQLKQKLEVLFEQKGGKIPQAILDKDKEVDSELKRLESYLEVDPYGASEAIRKLQYEWLEQRNTLLQQAADQQRFDEASREDIKLHQLIREYGIMHTGDYRALYCLLEQINLKNRSLYRSTLEQSLDPICFDPQFLRLHEKIKQQKKLEQFHVYSFNALLGTSIDEHTPISLKFEKEGVGIVDLKFETPAASAPISSLGYYLPSHLKTNKEMSLSPAARALREDYWRESILIKRNRNTGSGDWAQRIEGYIGGTKFESNQVQFLEKANPSGPFITKDNFFTRQLFHLRTSSRLQVNLTLDWAITHIDKLEDPELQAYVEANIFESGLLLELLDKEKERTKSEQRFLFRLDAFIQKGLHRFKTSMQLPSQSSLFFMQLNLYINRYVVEHTPELAAGRLIDDHNRLNAAIKGSVDPAILASLHQYRFEAIMVRYQCDDIVDELELSSALVEAFESYCFIHAKSNPGRAIDLAAELELNRIGSQFKDWLNKAGPGVIESRIKPMMTQLGLDVSELTLSGDYPDYTLADMSQMIIYKINAEQGLVYKDNKAYSNIPLDIKNHRVMCQLGLEQESSCMVLHKSQQYEFMTAEQHVRMKKTKEGLIVQKKWCIDGVEDWYELQPLTKKQQEQFELASTYSVQTSLPEGLTDGTTAAWVKQDQQGSFISQNGLPAYRVSEAHELEQLNRNGNLTGRILAPLPQFYKLLAQFEAPNLFQLNLNSNSSNTGQVDFSRYGLSLEIEKDGIKLPETSYHLALPEASPFKPEIAQLTFADPQGRAQICITPVQPFYVDLEQPGVETGDYYQLTHDTSEHIGTERLKKKWEKSAVAEKGQPQWHYQDSATYITYKLVNGLPKANTSADALYLCYLYLASHEHEKAWAVLNDLSRMGLDGTPQELTYLSWIVKALPILLEDEDKQASTGLMLSIAGPGGKTKRTRDKEKATQESPRDTVCQLKALSLYTQLLQRGIKPLIPEPSTCDLTTANGQYQALCLEEIQQFYKDLPETIYALYDRLQKNRRHISDKFILQDSECKRLLNFYHQSCRTDNRATGSLGYEWRRLNLKMLVSEFNQLNAIRDSGMAISPMLTKRLSEIEATLSEHVPIMKQSTELELSAIDISLPEQPRIREEFLTRREQSVVWNWNMGWGGGVFNVDNSDSELAAFLALTSMIEESEFIKFFPHYARAAIGENNEKRAVLREFCVNYLIAHRHLPIDKQESIIPFLANILYRMIENPGCCEACGTINNVIDKVKDLAVTPIEAYQVKNVFQEELSNNRELWNSLSLEASKRTLITIKPYFPSAAFTTQGVISTCSSKLNDEDKVQFNDCLAAYANEEHIYQTKLNEFISSDNEHAAGKLKYDCIQKQQNIARKGLSSPSIRNTLKTQTLVTHEALNASLEAQWGNVLELANRELKDKLYIQVGASQRYLLTKQELLKCYFDGTSAAYLEMTALTLEEVVSLHNQIHQCVALEVEQQHLMRLKNALLQAESEPNEPSHIELIASILMSKNHVDTQNDPTVMLFQYLENVMLRPRQVDALKNLLSKTSEPDKFNESVEKVIMGGGKSKVILPLLAQKKATGVNLTIVEVPRALLSTNHADLNSTSHKLFGQKAHRFEFDRDSDCSAKRLEEIYQNFLEIITNKDYLVTTGEAMQSLELKYLELLLSKPEDPKQQAIWQQQILWGSKILGLIKQRGDVVIDEIHQGLLLKKKLNYTLGEQKSINPELIKHTLKLYDFMDILAQERYPEHAHLATQERMALDWINQQDELINGLLMHPSSPLIEFIQELNQQYDPSEVNVVLSAYLNDKKDTDILRGASQPIRDAFALYKEQLRLLPQTLHRHHKEHYGPSKSSKDAVRRTLAIPYAANDRPNERSRFGNPLETLNYSIQSLLIDGLNESLLIELVKQWQGDSCIELENDYATYKELEFTPTAEMVSKYLEGTPFKLHQIDITNKSDIQVLTEHLKHNKTLLLTLLEQRVLPQITLESAILHSDAYNHVDLYRSTQGVSGTPWNHNTYHHRLNFNHKTSLGTDGYIQEVIKGKNTPIHALGFTNLSDFLPKLYDKVGIEKKGNVRAIMDISATFQGCSNISVAEALATFHKETNPPLKYILYYNDDDVLYALDVQQKKSPIRLGTSDPDEITLKLSGCKPEERFTYYDQAHTVGTDIAQASYCGGMCLVDSKTHLQSFLQGSMRMRGLDKNQQIDVIVPEDMADLSLDELLRGMEQNEWKQLKEDKFIGTLAAMDNVIRNDLLKRIASLDDGDVETKHQWATTFERFLVKKNESDIYKQYGGVSHEEDASFLLRNHQARLMKEWQSCLVKADITIDIEQNLQILTTVMDELIATAIPMCHKTYMSRVQQNNEALEVEVMKEQEVAKEVEKLVEEERYDGQLYVSRGNSWRAEHMSAFVSGSKELGGQWDKVTINALNDLCPSYNDKNTPLFSPQLLATDNYSNAYYNQQNMLGFYIKPVDVVLFRKEGDTVTACLVSNQEADEIAKLIDKEPQPSIWLSSTAHTPLVGTVPKDIQLNLDYLALMEQVQFFAGKCNEMPVQEQITSALWLEDETKEKLAWFEKNIMPYRETDPHDVTELKNALAKRKAIKMSLLETSPEANVEQRSQSPDLLKVKPNPMISVGGDSTFFAVKSKHTDVMAELKKEALLKAVIDGLKQLHEVFINEYKECHKGYEVISDICVSAVIVLSNPSMSMDEKIGALNALLNRAITPTSVSDLNDIGSSSDAVSLLISSSLKSLHMLINQLSDEVAEPQILSNSIEQIESLKVKFQSQIDSSQSPKP